MDLLGFVEKIKFSHKSVANGVPLVQDRTPARYPLIWEWPVMGNAHHEADSY
jgi:hypothetical protein